MYSAGRANECGHSAVRRVVAGPKNLRIMEGNIRVVVWELRAADRMKGECKDHRDKNAKAQDWNEADRPTGGFCAVKRRETSCGGHAIQPYSGRADHRSE